MKVSREAAAIILIIIGFPAIYFGNIFFFIVFAFLLCVAAWEFGRLYRPLDVQASDVVIIVGTFATVLARYFNPSRYPLLAPTTLTIVILVAITFYLVSYERGRDRAGMDFVVTLGGIIYIGWIGAYLMDLRALPNGLGWFMATMGSVWLADSSAYYIGSRVGKHKMSPRLSPKKSWEGYFASIIGGGISGTLLILALNAIGFTNTSLVHGAILGLLIGALPTLGDLGESMIKRQVNIKDSGGLIPGHGGAFDRIDSWIWAATIGYFYVSLFVL
jgi:phosphatidate cytidylyltransferase